LNFIYETLRCIWEQALAMLCVPVQHMALAMARIMHIFQNAP
jgi:hypothetical protein